ncbi:sensor protein, partial [mine drainage metagenome]
MRSPRPRAGRGPLARFFGVIGDARSYGALFYMLLALATGIFYFTWAVAGLSLSAGLAVLIIGIPFIVLFLASVRLLALVEGRLVEVMLGVRMPRRPASAVRELPLLKRIGAMFTDPRTWGTLFYMLLMLPLG